MVEARLAEIGKQREAVAEQVRQATVTLEEVKVQAIPVVSPPPSFRADCLQKANQEFVSSRQQTNADNQREKARASRIFF